MKELLDFQPKVNSAIGLWTEGNWAMAARVSIDAGVLIIDSVQETTFGPQDVKPLYNLMQSVGTGIGDSWIVSAISTQKVLLRPLHVTLTKPADIDKILSFQAEPLLPYPVEEAILDRFILSSTPEGSHLCLAAVRQDDLAQHLQVYQQSDIEPESCSCAPAGLASFAALYASEHRSLLIIDLEPGFSTCVLVQSGVPISAHHIPIGVDGSGADSGGEVGKELLQKLGLASRSLFKQMPESEKPPLLIVGLGAEHPAWAQSIAKHLETSIATCAASSEQLRFACPIGLAASVLSPQPSAAIPLSPLNLRKAALAYPKPWKRFAGALLTYGAACLLLTLSLIAFGQARSHRQDYALRHEYANLLNVLNLTPEQAEKRFGGEVAAPDFTLASLDREALRRRLSAIDKDLSRPQELYPLEPAIPRVSDVLAWLSSHFDKEVKLESIGYTMVKRPDPKHPGERYQVRVDIEFTASPQKAKAFHDALMTPNPIVANVQGVKFSSAGGVYRTSFDLQDRTLY